MNVTYFNLHKRKLILKENNNKIRYSLRNKVQLSNDCFLLLFKKYKFNIIKPFYYFYSNYKKLDITEENKDLFFDYYAYTKGHVKKFPFTELKNTKIFLLDNNELQDYNFLVSKMESELIINKLVKNEHDKYKKISICGVKLYENGNIFTDGIINL